MKAFEIPFEYLEQSPFVFANKLNRMMKEMFYLYLKEFFSGKKINFIRKIYKDTIRKIFRGDRNSSFRENVKKIFGNSNKHLNWIIFHSIEKYNPEEFIFLLSFQNFWKLFHEQIISMND